MTINQEKRAARLKEIAFKLAEAQFGEVEEQDLLYLWDIPSIFAMASVMSAVELTYRGIGDRFEPYAFALDIMKKNAKFHGLIPSEYPITSEQRKQLRKIPVRRHGEAAKTPDDQA
jgi:hypothetical protein